jgi:hypothetical protein
MKEMCLNFNELGFFITPFDGMVSEYPCFHDRDSLLRAIYLLKEVAIYNKNSIYLWESELTYQREPTLSYSLNSFIVVAKGSTSYTFHFTRMYPESYLIDVNHLLNILDEFSNRYVLNYGDLPQIQ